MVNASDIINWTQGPTVVLTHAGPATNHWYGWILTFSIWAIIFFSLFIAGDRKWALAAASFVGLIAASVGFVLTWNTEALIILQLVLLVVGGAAGFVSEKI